MKGFIWSLNSLFISTLIILLPTDNTYKSMGQGYNQLIYIHVPTAWLSMLFYLVIGVLSCIYLIRRNPRIINWIEQITKVGILNNAITLVTGSIWAKYTWGSYWVWESRQVLVLILLIMYIISLILIKQGNDILGSKIRILGLLNLPLIKYSVEWWTGLHQSESKIEGGMEEEVIIIIGMVTVTILVINLWLIRRNKDLGITPLL